MTQSRLNDYLFDAIQEEASDLHITVGLPPMIRVHGKVRPLDYPPLTSITTREMIYDILTNDQRQRLENDWELDFSYTLPRTTRFRVNVYFQRGFLGAAFRTIPQEIKSIKELALPDPPSPPTSPEESPRCRRCPRGWYPGQHPPQILYVFHQEGKPLIWRLLYPTFKEERSSVVQKVAEPLVDGKEDRRLQEAPLVLYK